MDFNEGLVFEKVREILTRGHVISEAGVGKIEDRADLPQNVVLLTRFDFCKVLKMVMMFATKLRKNRRIISHSSITYFGVDKATLAFR